MKTLLLLATFATLLSGCMEKDAAALMLAKDMCSCRFVNEQPESHCRGSMRMALILGNVTVDEANQEATGTSNEGTHPATFRFVSSRFGCALKN